MSTVKHNGERKLSLPTLDRLQATVPPDVSPGAVASNWLQKFSKMLQSSDLHRVGTLSELFLEDALWKDILAVTWDYRSIHGIDGILALVNSRAQSSGLSVSVIADDPFRAPLLRSPFPDMSWIQFGFDLETSVGKGQGYARLVPTSDGTWKGFTLCTSLESLSGFTPPEMRNPAQEHSWKEKRFRQNQFLDNDPTVLVIGAGHSGLELAARLERLGVSTLIVEKTARVGDNWRDRYTSLCLHDPIWYDQLPYLQFPTTWPVYSPKDKLADWLESYAQSLELNIWTSSAVNRAILDETNNTWKVDVMQKGGDIRSMQIKHLVFANGLGGGKVYSPEIPKKELYSGVIEHSATFRSAKDFIGKKVIVVGAGNSGHDIAQDFANHGVDVTMFQRSSTYVISRKALAAMVNSLYNENGPPADVADRLNGSIPNNVAKLVHQRAIAGIAATIDKDILTRLKSVGFMLNMGPDDGGAVQAFLRNGGGYYVDVGASSLIADGTIHLKAGGEIQEFTRNGLKFTDGVELEADVVIFATGFGNQSTIAKEICGPAVAEVLGPVWGLDSEGELRSAWRGSGHPQLYFAAGNFSMSRFYSHYLALQIKAHELGVLNERYSIVA